MSIDLDVLERLAAEATPGPWAADPMFGDGGAQICETRVGTVVCEITDRSEWEPDAAFIAACDPATVAALVRAVKAARAYQLVAQSHDWDEARAYSHDLDEALAPFRGQP